MIVKYYDDDKLQIITDIVAFNKYNNSDIDAVNKEQQIKRNRLVYKAHKYAKILFNTNDYYVYKMFIAKQMGLSNNSYNYIKIKRLLRIIKEYINFNLVKRKIYYKLVTKITKEQMDLLKLYYIYNVTYSQLAEIKGVSYSTIKRRMKELFKEINKYAPEMVRFLNKNKRR